MNVVYVLVGLGGILISFLVIYGIIWDGLIGTFREKWESNAYEKGFEAGRKYEQENVNKKEPSRK